MGQLVPCVVLSFCQFGFRNICVVPYLLFSHIVVYSINVINVNEQDGDGGRNPFVDEIPGVEIRLIWCIGEKQAQQTCLISSELGLFCHI